jgi:dolichol-phosphate mannosyltransferase
MTPLNWVGNKIFSLLIQVLTNVPTTDASSGLRVFKKKSIDLLDIQANGLDYEIEMTVKANKRKLKIIEIPITYEKRAGKSKLNPLKDGWRFFKAILRAYLER